MTTTYTLQELVERIELDRWNAWREAVDVLNRGFHPPESWSAEIAAGVQAYIDSEQAQRLQRYDTNDLVVFTVHTGIRMEAHAVTNADLVAWKKATPNWPEQMAKWRERRAEYADDSLVREQAPGIVTRRLAIAKAKALGEEIDKAVLKAITASDVVVRAGAVKDRHEFSRLELREAAIDILRNTLTVDGIVFPRVEVGLPAVTSARSKAAAKKQSVLARKGGRKPRERDGMLSYLQKHHRKGVPGNLKTAALLHNMNDAGVPGGVKTLRRAMRKHHAVVLKTP